MVLKTASPLLARTARRAERQAGLELRQEEAAPAPAQRPGAQPAAAGPSARPGAPPPPARPPTPVSHRVDTASWGVDARRPWLAVLSAVRAAVTSLNGYEVTFYHRK
jgi:hypothetical protein